MNHKVLLKWQEKKIEANEMMVQLKPLHSFLSLDFPSRFIHTISLPTTSLLNANAHQSEER